MCTTYEVEPRKNEDGAKTIIVKITIMQQRSTEQRSTVDLRHRLHSKC